MRRFTTEMRHWTFLSQYSRFSKGHFVFSLVQGAMLTIGTKRLGCWQCVEIVPVAAPTRYLLSVLTAPE